MPIFLWLRRITADKLHDLHRHHLGAKVRDARRETPVNMGPAGPEATSSALATHLVKEGPSPSNAAMEAERHASLEAWLKVMDPLDREIIALRCFERLSGKEAAVVLGIQAAAARQRYFRALKRLKEIIGPQWDPSQEPA